MKILIAYDGSDCAVAALDDLCRAGMPCEAEATIISVSEVWFPQHNSITATTSTKPQLGIPQSQAAFGVQLVTETSALALQARSRLQNHFPSWKINAEESSGSPVREILKKADQINPDLIVVGSQGRSGLGRFLLGSVSQKVVNEAPCSVRVARGTVWKNGAPVRILLGLEGSFGSTAAVDEIAGRPWPLASEVRIVTVIDPQRAVPNSPTLRQPTTASRVENFVQAATEKLTDADLTVTSRIEHGDPKQLLIAAAEEWGAECIFIGASCEPQSFERLLLGTVATAVVARAHCSVEVIRRRRNGLNARPS